MYSSFKNRVGPNPCGWYTAIMRAISPGGAHRSRYLCRIMRKIIDHMHVLFRLGHCESSGHTLEMFLPHRQERAPRSRNARRRKAPHAGFQGCGFPEAANDIRCPCEKASPRSAGAVHGPAATRPNCFGRSPLLREGLRGSDRPRLTQSMERLTQASQKALLSRQRSYGPWKY